MYITPLNFSQKVGVVIYGLLAALGMALGTSAALLMIGIALSLAGNAGWIHLGDYQPWLSLAGMEYGFLIGLVLGGFVCRRIWRSCLRRMPTE